MHSLWLPRLFAGVLGFAVITWLSEGIAVSIMLLLAVSHTILAAYYSRNRAKALLTNEKKTGIGLLLLAAVSIVSIYYDAPPMYYLVLIHHIFNENYTALEADYNYLRKISLRASLIAFEVVVFICCTYVDFKYFFFKIDTMFASSLLAVTFAGVMYTLHRDLPAQEKSGSKIFVISGFLMALYSLNYKALGIDFIILYHFLFWVIYPAFKAHHFTQKISFNYWAQTGVLMLLCLPFTQLWTTSYSLNVDQMSYVTRAVGYFHIFTSLALSASNPTQITQFFQNKNLSLWGPSETNQSKSAS